MNTITPSSVRAKLPHLCLPRLAILGLAWMAALALLILIEKNAPAGERAAQVAAVVFALGGVALLARPETLTALT